MTDYAVSENEQVQQFLDDLMATDIDKYFVQEAFGTKERHFGPGAHVMSTYTAQKR
mgnify:CR=1 FL=1